ncbi:MAG TPA: hypothetical protein VGF45_03850, partial [Polyangia bacterium]
MGTRLFVGNLSYNVNEQELKESFLAEGIEVRSVKVALDRESGRPRGFAFVETVTEEGAKLSVEKMAGKMLQGRAIVIEEAQARPAGPRPGGPPGAGGPGGGGGGYGGPRPGGFGGGGPRPGGFGGGPSGPRPPGSFSGPGGGGPPRPGFGPPRPGFGGGPMGGPPPARANDRPGGGMGERRERPEKKRSSRPKPE